MKPVLNVLKAPVNALRFAGTHRVLVADDEPINRTVHVKFIQKYNKEQSADQFETTTAHDGQDAFEKIEDAYQQGKPFDVLITDNSMPRKTGLQLIRELGGMRPFTAMISSDHVKDEALSAGAQVFLPKPATMVGVWDILKRYQGLLTCPLPELEPGLMTSTSKEEAILGPHTSTGTGHNPFEHAFGIAAAEKRRPSPVQEE